MSREAEKQSFREVGETCPAVDAALSAASEAIKEQTTALRYALVDAIDRAMQAENERDELQEEVDRLQNRVADLEHELARTEVA